MTSDGRAGRLLSNPLGMELTNLMSHNDTDYSQVCLVTRAAWLPPGPALTPSPQVCPEFSYIYFEPSSYDFLLTLLVKVCVTMSWSAWLGAAPSPATAPPPLWASAACSDTRAAAAQ